MGIKLDGFDNVLAVVQDEEIMWAVKRKTLIEVAEEAAKDASEASHEIQDTGMLKKMWKFSFYNDDGVATARVYSSAYHDIYNEFGSPTNRKHIGFYSRNVDANLEKYWKMIEEGILDDSK
jgi:hypothetical protein